MSTFIRSLLVTSVFATTIVPVSAAPDYLIYLDRSVYETTTPAAVQPVSARESLDFEKR